MIRPRWRALAWLASASAVLLMLSSRAQACLGPDTEVAFHWSHHPDFPLDRFAAGRLGLLEPSYARSYLVVAYRYLMDRPLSAEEQQGAIDLWQRRLNGPGTYLDLAGESEDLGEDEWEWQRSREILKEIPIEHPVVETLPGPDERFRVQIPMDLSSEAGAMLQRRIARWGKTDARLKAWVQAQDQVFACTPQTPRIPEALPSSEPLDSRRDRAYQIAVARYLSGDLEGAESAFQAITKDGASPWRKGAWVMQARVWWRRAGRLPETDVEGRQACLHKAAEILRTRDPEDQRYSLLGQQVRFAHHALATRSRMDGPDWDFKAYCLEKAARASENPVQRTRELAAMLAKRSGTPDFTLDLGDYTILLDRQIRNEPRFDVGRLEARTIPSALLQDDLTRWVFLFREPADRAFPQALARWQATGSRPWLVLALMTARADSPALESLLADAAKVPESYPGATMVDYHRARLAASLGRHDEARRLAAQVLERGPSTLSPSAFNRFRALRMPLARNLAEAIADAQRIPAGLAWPEGEGGEGAWMYNPYVRRVRRWEARSFSEEVGQEHPRMKTFFQGYGGLPALLEGDGAALLNRELPLARMIEASEMEGLPPHLRDEWQRAAWVKAALLGRWEEAKRVARHLTARGDLLAAPLRRFLDAADPAREALWILLHHPGLRWYAVEELHWRTRLGPPTPVYKGNARDLKRLTHFGGNWWRDIPAMRNEHRKAPFAYGSPATGLTHRFPSALGFLSQEDREVAVREFHVLETLGSGPFWLCKETLAWAESEPRDPRVPEALHYAVKSARFADASPYQARAFRLLHRRYPASEWTAKTPVWR